MNDRRIGPPADGSKPPRNRWYDISPARVLLIIAIGLLILWMGGCFG